jgi:hypothetical protein
MNRQQRRAMKSKKRQGFRVSSNVTNKRPKFVSWQALENRSIIENKKDEV